MALILPILNDAAFRYEVSLDGRTYDLRVWWATDRGGPRLDLGLPRAGWLVRGVLLVRFWPLLYRLRHPHRPPGELYLIEKTSTLTALAPITRDSLLSGAQQLTYLTRAEIEAIEPRTSGTDAVRFVEVP